MAVRSHRVVFLILEMTVFAACIRLATPVPTPAEPKTIDGLINCAYVTPVPDRGSILPVFEPAERCELENVFEHVDFCMVNASPDLHYPCSQTESVVESILTRSGDRMLIQRDYHFEAGCWTGTSTDIRSLRVCDRASGDSVILADDVLGPFSISPDGDALVYVEPEPGSYRTRPHIFRMDVDGIVATQLDTQPFPQEQVMGGYVEDWSADGEWLKIRLWDGHQDGYHRYFLRADGSGEFWALP